MKKKIAILGSTGSIGKSLINIISKDKKNFDIVFLNGPNKENENIKTKIFERKSNIKIFEGRYKVKNSEKLDKTQNYLAFSGIGNPENFYITLKEINLNISKVSR